MRVPNAIDEAIRRVFFGRLIDIRENGAQATLLGCMHHYLNG
jgi:hypothetical protein